MFFESEPTSKSERDSLDDLDAVKKRDRERFACVCLLIAFSSLGIGVYAISLGGPYYGDGKREVMQQAINAGVAEFVEVEVQYARGRTSKRQEFRWKKCPDSAQNGVAK